MCLAKTFYHNKICLVIRWRLYLDTRTDQPKGLKRMCSHYNQITNSQGIASSAEEQQVDKPKVDTNHSLRRVCNHHFSCVFVLFVCADVQHRALLVRDFDTCSCLNERIRSNLFVWSLCINNVLENVCRGVFWLFQCFKRNDQSRKPQVKLGGLFSLCKQKLHSMLQARKKKTEGEIKREKSIKKKRKGIRKVELWWVILINHISTTFLTTLGSYGVFLMLPIQRPRQIYWRCDWFGSLSVVQIGGHCLILVFYYKCICTESSK